MSAADWLARGDRFVDRHLGPQAGEIDTMLAALGLESLDALVDSAVPDVIRTVRPLDLPPARSEREVIADLAQLAGQNQVWRSYLGYGYAGTVTPPVILRNILENPGWYTAYTPYQPEIAQGRLEALLVFQTMLADLTGMEVANASLLDEGTAAAEAMTLCLRVLSRKKKGANRFFVHDKVHPQTLAVVQTRAEPLGIEVVVGDPRTDRFDQGTFGVLVQDPDTEGRVDDWSAVAERAHSEGALVVAATDLLALCVLREPGAWGADVVVGNSQRFGVPMGFGGPHAAFMATSEAYKRQLPGRVVGVSVDVHGKPALRLALQTREQHIRREKATSNICTAQVLLAVIAGMYAVYHGPEGLRGIAGRVNAQARVLAAALTRLGHQVVHGTYFDTVAVRVADPAAVQAAAEAHRINLRALPDGVLTVALDETVTREDLADLVAVFGGGEGFSPEALAADLRGEAFEGDLFRTSGYLTHPTFHSYRTETEMLRYLKRLEERDLSLTTSMIPLGSCTMKLNATAEMAAVTWPGFGALHPFVPAEQCAGYLELFARLERWLAEITGLAATSLQPNAGSQGEYAGLLAIRGYHRANGDQRDVCLIPRSAHGTNPASAVLAGMKVVVVACDDDGNIDLDDLQAKATLHADRLAALMVTYPSTHGVFEAAIREICGVVHEHGGQVYMDGANMNALVGLSRPAELGADVIHLNLHKTFCIPHGGGGPGMGPICVGAHLAPHLPGHPMVGVGGDAGAVSAAPWGSASILPISYAYIAMMGAEGLTLATEVAICSANYMALRLGPHFPVLYTGQNGRVAHECIVDLRPLKVETGVTVDDVAKRLMDYGFHAPTMSFPVVGTLMIEPTESENLAEIDRLCDALIAIRAEAQAIADGASDRQDNALKGAPHTAQVVTGAWDRGYSREQAAFPAAWTRQHKYWPPVGRIDNAYGDRNLICACVTIDAFED